MAASNPTFFFISGAWHTSEYFDEVVGLLAEKGYHSEAMSLPSVGANPPLPDFEKDVEAISKAVTKVINSGKDVILVVHSYGGIPACQAIGAIMDDNEGENGKGKLRRMVWITSFIPQENQSLYTIVGHTPSWWKIEGSSVTAEDPAHIFYNDLPSDAAIFWVSKLKKHSYETFKSAVSVEPWLKIPSSYLVCDKDIALPPQGQDGMIAAAKEKSGGKAFDHVERCKSGHTPFLSMPGTVVEFLERVAGRI